MNVMIVCPTLAFGGAETVSVNLANEFVKKGVSVELIVFDDTGILRSEISKDVKLHALRYRKARFAVFGLYLHIAKRRPDYVISMLRAASTAVGISFRIPFLKSKLVIREASLYVPSENTGTFQARIESFILKLAYRSCDAFIANSEGTLKTFNNHKVLSKKTVVKVIGNPVLTDELEEQLQRPVRHPWFRDKRFKIIVSAGRLHEVKDQGNLIRAFKIVVQQIPEARLVIFGDGPERENLHGLIKVLELEDLVSLAGYEPRPVNYIAKADVFVLSSKREGFGNVIVEALVTGIPVISTDCPGNPGNLLGHGKYGILVPVGDSNALADAIKTVLSGTVEPFTGAKLRAMEFSSDKIADTYLNFLRTL
jgi:glycosyltransferase involved in cell wall biosynthesis